MSQVNTSMNFLPEDYVEKRQAARAAIVFIGLLLVVIGGIVGAYLFTQWNMKGVFEERDRVNAAYEDASKKIAEAQELQKQKELMVQKAEITTQLMERVRRSALLGELSRLLPPSVNFVGLDLKTHELMSAPKPPTDIEKIRRAAEGGIADYKPPTVDVTLTLTGTAPTDGEVAAYMSALQKSALLTNVSLLFSEEFKKNKDEKVMRKFNIEMHLDPTADLRGGSVADALPKN